MPKGHRISASTGLDRGDREHQQDQLCLLTHPRVAGCLLAVVADGMGGRSGGRKASDQVMMTAHQLFERYSPDTDKPTELLQQLVNEAHLVIKLTAVAAEEEPHSTVAAFVLSPDGRCDWIHSGDSRIYHFRKGRMLSRTLDHSLVQKMVNEGQITEAEALKHPNGNVLMGCLGTERDPPTDTRHIEQLMAGDALLACSDGLWHYFNTEEMARAVDMLSAREACEFLLQKARARAQGTGDNLALVVVKIEALN
jgi:serine/threonine protein phosphatase PrpC